ncbi:MAG: alpha/beta hydrolase [Poseidonia sp.]
MASWLLLPTSIATLIVAIGLFWTYIECVTQLAFRAPQHRKPPIDDERWNPQLIHSGEHQLSTYHQVLNPHGPTVWLCHGWTSGSQRMLGRADIFLNRGWNVVMLDLPNHGASSKLNKWTAEQSTTLLIDVANKLAEDHQGLFGGQVYYFGHSMGGFLGLRLSQRRNELTFGDRFSGWMFESPMTGYTEIFQETCNILRIPHLLRPLVLDNTLRHVNALIAPRSINSLDEADAPRWGMPDEPTLVVQASPDERLGMNHYERLLTAMNDRGRSHLLSSHLLTSLRHTGANKHAERDQIIHEWLNSVAHSSSD